MEAEQPNMASPSKATPLTASMVPKKPRLLIGGVNVEFPHEPYSVQKYMMSQVITAMNKMQNCLLESPTGTGKTLGLLCSTLAWQMKEGNDLQKLQEELRKEKNEKDNLKDKSAAVQDRNSSKSSTTTLKREKEEGAEHQKQPGGASEDTFDHECSSDDDVFQLPKRLKKSFPSFGHNPESVDIKKQQSAPEDVKIKDQRNESHHKEGGESKLELNEDEMQKFKPPTIFYGTRTHKQITQVVDQLKKTSYSKDVRMSILASRDFTCVNPTVKGKPRIADLCKECIDPANNIGCTYYQGATKVATHSTVQGLGLPVVFDIEDIVAMGTKRRVCPYYTLRNIVKSSDIVFCPYNYLIHPVMRESMNINLKGSIVIMDEAHNIEDICRDTASLCLKSDNVAAAVKECREEKKHGMAEEYKAIENYLVMLENYIISEGPKQTYTNDQSVITLPGFTLIERLHDVGVTMDAFQDMLDNVSRIDQARSEDPESNALNGLVKQVCSDINCCFKHLYLPENKMKFQACFLREVGFKSAEPDNWFSKHKRNTSSQDREWKYALQVVCLDPSLVFKDLSCARTIILASGTLSPLDSFITELGVEFKNIVKGKHVVPAGNLYVSSISNGPKGYALRGTYNVIHEYYYQDELGRIILETSKIVPHGVLCFLPSYSLMTKLCDRWRSNGMLDELSTVKEVFWEPRNRDEMESVMSDFNNTIDESRHDQSALGAILFGVYRGKIAEGIDFSDENARVVIAVGIPFQNRYSFDVKEKIKYNDEMFQKNKNHLSGSKWYSIQAYRALNQALGRCIRHQNDWGAIVLVDSRFSSTDVQDNLPIWIRSQIRTFQSWQNYTREIQQFNTRMKNSANPNHHNHE